MRVFTLKKELKKFHSQLDSEASLGFVPTMGALHEGHIDLVRRACQENTEVILSIYVNPTQFNNAQDLEKYPRDLENDLAKLHSFKNLSVFAPDNQSMYPQATRIQFSFGALENSMEGKYRPGHFSGVALVVSKLFHLVQPHRAYFGQKDLQQSLIIRQLVLDLNFDLELIVCPTVREASGLALSSRNRRLSPSALSQAELIPNTLFQAQDFLQKQEKSLAEVITWSKDRFKQSALELEYFHIVDRYSLQDLKHLAPGQELAICLAAYLEGVRLLDNVICTL